MVDSDERLLWAWRQGDRAAGSRLFQRHFRVVHRFLANKVGDDAEIEDLVQRTFVAVVEDSSRFQGRSSFRTYLLGIAYNFVRNHFRKRARLPKWDPGRHSVADLGMGVSTLHRHKREQRLLLEALRHIPLGFQTLLELYYWENMTGGALAEVFEIPENTVRARLRRAKKLLREAIEGLEASRSTLESTVENLERWAASIREGFDSERDGSRVPVRT